MIQGVHINSSKPFFYKYSQKEYSIDDFEILCTILSALMWRLNNGPIKLYTDNIGLEFYKSLGIEKIWSAGIDTQTLEAIPENINQEIFWAAAKIFVAKQEKIPFALIDTDLIVWEDIQKILNQHQLAVIHRESLDIDCYLPYEFLKKRTGYTPDPIWDWSELPCNTAFAFFNNADFVDYYTSSAIDFMTDNGEYPKEMVSQMVFAEQRIFSMCAKAKNLKIHSFLDDPFDKGNTTFTHLWGTKSMARKNVTTNAELCTILLKKLKKEFPNFTPETEKLKTIFNNYR